MKRINSFNTVTLFLMGCYQTSLAPVLGPAAGASQGRIAHSAISSGISYGVKNQTGKYPIEHILKREKNKIVKKIDLIEKEVVEKSIYAKTHSLTKKTLLKKNGCYILKR